MELTFNIYSVTLLVAGVVAGLTTAGTMLRSGVSGRTFSIMMALITVWAIAYALELSVRTLDEMLFWIRIEYIGIALIPAFWLLFCIQFTGYDSVLNRRALPLLFVFPLITLLMVWSNDWHNLHYSSVAVADIDGLRLLDFEPGPWYLSHLLLFYLYLATGVVLLIRKYLTAKPIIRRQLMIILAGMAIPWAANGLYIAGFRPFGHMDITPFAFVVTGVVISVGLMRFKLFEFLPVAREQIIEEMEEGILIVDENYQVLDMNASMRGLLGPGGGEADGASLQELFPREEELLNVIFRGEKVKFEYRMKAGQAASVYEITIKPYHNRKGVMSGLTILFRNITRQKETEAELRSAREQAERASRSKSDFLAHMSHEIRTPLNGVIGFADLIMQTDLSPTQRRYLQAVYSSSLYLLDIVNDILDLSQIEAGKMQLDPEEVDLKEFCSHVAELFSWRASEKGLDFDLVVDPDLPGWVRLDVRKLQQVLMNLLGNAFKFTEQGGVILRVEQRGKTKKGVKIRFVIKDSGIGIEPEYQKRIFEAFTQEDISTKKHYSGTGLGLAISNQLLALMDSKIHLKSRKGAGSTFRFDLLVQTIDRSPAGDGVWEARRESPEGSQPALHNGNFGVEHGGSDVSTSRFTVLVVEDNKVNSLLMRSIVSRYFPSAVVLSAEDGKRALELAADGNPDLIFMDVQMPVMNGYEASERIRSMESGRRVPIIAITATEMEEVRERCQRAGMDDYLAKPILPPVVRQMILKWLPPGV